MCIHMDTWTRARICPENKDLQLPCTDASVESSRGFVSKTSHSIFPMHATVILLGKSLSVLCDIIRRLFVFSAGHFSSLMHTSCLRL